MSSSLWYWDFFIAEFPISYLKTTTFYETDSMAVMSRSEWKLRLNEESKSENIRIIIPFDFQGQRSKLGYSHGDTSCMIQILSIIFYKQYLYIYIYIYNIVLNASAGTLILRFISNTVTVVICVFAETWLQKGIICELKRALYGIKCVLRIF